MLSLDNATTPTTSASSRPASAGCCPDERFTYVCEPKIDGLGVALLYARGRFVRGATRGDGRVGEDITANIDDPQPADGAARPLAKVEDLEVRGEVFLPRAEFEQLNRGLEEAGEPPSPTLATPRRAPCARRTRRHRPPSPRRVSLSRVVVSRA